MTPHRPRGGSDGSARLRWMIVLLLIVGCTATEVGACPICFRFEESRAIDGLRMGVVVLVGITTMVLAGFGWFAAGFVRRSRRHP